MVITTQAVNYKKLLKKGKEIPAMLLLN